MSPEYGGPVTGARGLTSALASQGVHCEIATTRGATAPEPIPGVRLHEFGTGFPAPYYRAYSRQLKRFLADQVGNFDVIHSYETWSYATFAAFHAARKHKVPVVVMPADSLGVASRRYKRVRKWLYRKLVLDDILRKADCLHLLSRGEIKQVDTLGYTTPRIIVPNGVSLAGPAPGAKAEFLEAYPLLAGKRVILFVGRLHWGKGVDVLARSFALLAAKFPDAVLLVVGPEDGAGGDFAAELATAGLLDRTVLTGMLYGARLRAAYHVAEIFVLPSRGESSSNALLEAMAAGLPVVISEHCNLPEVAEHGGGFVVPLDAESVSEAIGKLLTDARLGARMGSAARKLVGERYTWPSVAAAMAEHYRGLIA